MSRNTGGQHAFRYQWTLSLRSRWITDMNTAARSEAAQGTNLIHLVEKKLWRGLPVLAGRPCPLPPSFISGNTWTPAVSGCSHQSMRSVSSIPITVQSHVMLVLPPETIQQLTVNDLIWQGGRIWAVMRILLGKLISPHQTNCSSVSVRSY